VVTAAYIVIVIQFEERDHVQYHGKAYEEYRRRVPMLIPFTRGTRAWSSTPASTSSPNPA